MVAALARKPNVTVLMDSTSAKKKVEESSNWVAENMKTAFGFGAVSHCRTSQGAELQQELISFLNAGILDDDGINILPISTTRAVTESGEEINSNHALKLLGVTKPFKLQPKEGLALVNGTAVGFGLASTVCYDANILNFFTEIASALFCEVMQGKPEFTDHLTHKLKHHLGQIEAAAIMEWVLEHNSYMKAAAKLSSS